MAVPETVKTEVPPVYEEVAMVDPMSELVDVGMPDVYPMIAVLIAAFDAVTFAVCKAVTFASLKAVTFASFEAVTIFPFVAVVQVSITAFLIVDRSALRFLVSATELTARTTVKCRCPRGATRHHRVTATAKVSTTVNGCATAKAWTGGVVIEGDILERERAGAVGPQGAAICAAVVVGKD